MVSNLVNITTHYFLFLKLISISCFFSSVIYIYICGFQLNNANFQGREIFSLKLIYFFVGIKGVGITPSSFNG